MNNQSEKVIISTGLTKEFRVHNREPGLRSAFKSLVHREFRSVHAVSGVDFSVTAGEIVGYLGPNGAGKTTTLKMLAGLLHPTSGSANVLGNVPWERKPEHLRRIAFIMGNRNQLWWDLPAMETFQLMRKIYDIPNKTYKKIFDELVSILKVEPLLKTPVRQLSLGERMKMEIIGGLLHEPDVIFLDEPTLGLDVCAQIELRRFLKRFNREKGATMMISSHYVQDIEDLCDRVIIISLGKIMYDGDRQGLRDIVPSTRSLRIRLDREVARDAIPDIGIVSDFSPFALTIQVDNASAVAAARECLQHLPVADISFSEAPLDEVLSSLYRTGRERNNT